MELPTYTNIWKIEKRLYKLYDFRLPMPLPVGQIAAFLAIAVPYTIILTMVGMPFSHTWLWVYVLPPGVLAWLVTRPVLEGKRLPELVGSQLRYLTEPRTWCRLAPLAEKDAVVLTARVWRSAGYLRPATQTAGPGAAARSAPGLIAAGSQRAPSPLPRKAAVVRPVTAESRPIWPGTEAVPVRVRGTAAAGATGAARPVWPNAAPAQRVVPARPADPPERTELTRPSPLGTDPPTAQPVSEPAGTVADAPPAAGPKSPPVAPPPPVPAQQRRPVVRVTGDASATRPLNVVERALRTGPATAANRDPVVVVPGGHRPGKPDQVQRDQARARLPLRAPARIVVLGCTGGAGQTVTTLLTGHLLASLRGEAVAVLDLGSGQGSLTEQARLIPVLLPRHRTGAGPGPASSAGERGLQVVTARDSSDDPDQIMSAVVARYPLTLADPDAGRVPKAMRAADQLILVAPATAEASGSLAMTLEWLEAHDHAALAAGAITVLNGVSPKTAEHADRAAAVTSGRCRAIVQVPWDEHVRARQALGTATIHAYTALAGVLVAALADGRDASHPAQSSPPQASPPPASPPQANPPRAGAIR